MYFIKAKGVPQFYKDAKIKDIFIGIDKGSYGTNDIIWTSLHQHAETFSSIKEAQNFWKNHKNKIEMGYKILDSSIEIVNLEWATKKNLN